MNKPKTPCILYVSSFPPRECGIATFTEDLTNAMDKEYAPGIKGKILAINDNGTSIYNYPRKVIKQINETAIEDYLNRANEINRTPEIKLINIQHEYGLFGGEQGEFLIPFLELLNKPVVITMHTVLPRPDEKMKKVGRIISEKCHGIVVMNEGAKEVLANVYGIKENLISVIPHGVHHIPFPSKSHSQHKLGLNGHIVLSTFGMISRDKGIEYAIDALPRVVEKHPNVLYLILGATHPNVLKLEGEKYRNKLKKLIVKYKLEDHVKFYNKYMGLHELIEFLKATDIYIYPMLSPEQASSGSLSYAMSCGCPAIATASQYANSVLNNERGRLIRFRSAKDIREALLELIPDKKLRTEMKKNTYFFTRHMTWQNVALSYFKTFNHFAKIVPRKKDKLPPIKLDYIKILTDDFGMIQFAHHTKPDIYSGYCLDDNARALVGSIEWYKRKRIKSTLELINIYLKYIKFSQKKDGRFRVFVSYQKTFNDLTESEDSFGRAIWALGCLVSQDGLPENLRRQGLTILKKALPWVTKSHSLRAIAFSLIGVSNIIETSSLYLLTPDNQKKLELLVKKLADKLVKNYKKQIQDNNQKWQWFEDFFTYSNYKLPEALFRAFRITKNKEYKEVAEKSLAFLMNITFENPEYFSPIGQDGWYFRNGKRAYFDQQPEDAASAVEGLVEAYLITKKKIYKDRAELVFNWFLGKNHLNQMVYDEATGGCYDGLGKYSLNFNQGAESTISYFLARLAVSKLF